MRRIASITARASTSSGETLTSRNSRRPLQPVDELHRAGDVDGHPLGDVGDREGRADHRLAHHLADALDRLARLPLAAQGRLSGDRRRCTGVETHRWPPARRRGSRRRPGPEPAREARSTPRSLASLRTGGFARARAAAGDTGRCGRQARRARRGRRRRRARRARARRTPAAAAGPPRHRPRRGRRRGGHGVRRSGRPCCGRPATRPRHHRSQRGSTGRSVSAGGGLLGRGRGGVADRDDRGADRDGLALGDHQLLHDAGVRRRQLDQRLGGLDLDHDVVDRDRCRPP